MQTETGLPGILLFTGKILAVVCASNIFFGTWVGVCLAKRRTHLARFLDVLVSLPLVFPPVASGFFLLMVLGRHGCIGQGLLSVFNVTVIFSPLGVFLAAFLASFPLMVKSVKSSAMMIDRSIIEMAYTQGASWNQTLVYIIIPDIKNGILSGLTLSAARSLGEVGMTLILGGNITGRTETISLAIYNAVFDGDFYRATVFSLVLAGVSLIFFMAIQYIEKTETCTRFR
jgi:molybdate transport system permease protein